MIRRCCEGKGGTGEIQNVREGREKFEHDMKWLSKNRSRSQRQFSFWAAEYPFLQILLSTLPRQGRSFFLSLFSWNFSSTLIIFTCILGAWRARLAMTREHLNLLFAGIQVQAFLLFSHTENSFRLRNDVLNLNECVPVQIPKLFDSISNS